MDRYVPTGPPPTIRTSTCSIDVFLFDIAAAFDWTLFRGFLRLRKVTHVLSFCRL
jgi:hypothetical protein